MQPTFRALAVAAALASTLAACSGDDPTVASSPSATSPAETSTGQGQAAASVDIKDFAFVPEDIEVAVGTTVTFTNLDRFGHTATSGSAQAPTDDFDVVLGETSDPDTTGLTGTHTFDQAGTFEYYCRYHPSMVGTIVVG